MEVKKLLGLRKLLELKVKVIGFEETAELVEAVLEVTVSCFRRPAMFLEMYSCAIDTLFLP